MPTRRTLTRGFRALACGTVLVAMLAYNLPSEAQDTPRANPTWQCLLKIITGQPKPDTPCGLLYPQGPPRPWNEWSATPETNPSTGELVWNPISVVEKPHADWVTAFLNEEAVKSLKEWNNNRDSYSPSNLFKMEPDSILVKENYPAGTRPDLSPPLGQRDGILSITVLWKVAGYNRGQPLALSSSDAVPDAYLTGGDWFYSMFPGCCFKQKPKPKKGEPPPPCLGPQGADAWGNPSACNVLTLAVQGFMRRNQADQHRPSQFATSTGETVAEKAWFCQGCHNGATGVGRMKYRSFGDYIWMLAPFEQDPPPPPPPPAASN